MSAEGLEGYGRAGGFEGFGSVVSPSGAHALIACPWPRVHAQTGWHKDCVALPPRGRVDKMAQ